MGAHLIPDDSIITALKRARGCIHGAAEILGIAHETVLRRGKRVPEVKSLINQRNERLKKICVRGIEKLMRKGNVAALIFYAKTQLQWREVSTTNGQQTGQAGTPIIVIREAPNKPTDASAGILIESEAKP